MKESTGEEYESELLVVEGAIRHSINAFRTYGKRVHKGADHIADHPTK